MKYEHWHLGTIHAAFISTVFLFAAFCGKNAIGAELMRYNGFEDGFLEGTNNSGWSRSLSKNVPDSWVGASNSARDGNRGLKTYLDYSPGNNFRSEIVLKSVGPFKHATDYWFGWSIYVPRDWKVEPAKWDNQVLMQFHTTNDAGDKSTSPTTAVKIDNGKWVAYIKYATQPVSVGSQAIRWSQVIGNVVPGTWNDFAANIRFGWKDSQKPYYKLWKDGKQVVNRIGPTSSNDKVGPYWKLGQYNIGWKQNRPKAITSRTYYYDEIRVAGPDATLEDVAPWAASASQSYASGLLAPPEVPKWR